MKVTILKPNTSLFEGQAELLQLPGISGLFELMENHAPIISALKAGTIRLLEFGGEERLFEVNSGMVKAQRNEVIVLVQ